MDCIRRNGEKTYYRICYITKHHNSSETCVESVATDNGTIVFSDPSPQNYSVRVAAENSAGVGPFSEPVTIEVDSKHPDVNTCIQVHVYIGLP